MELISAAIYIIYAILSALRDLRYRTISLPLSLLAGTAGLSFSILGGRSFREISIALIPAVVFLLLSVLSGGSLGMGDALFIGVSALFLDFHEVLILSVYTWLICVLISASVIICGIAGLKTAAKFRKLGIPFVTSALPIVLIIIGTEFRYVYG